MADVADPAAHEPFRALDALASGGLSSKDQMKIHRAMTEAMAQRNSSFEVAKNGALLPKAPPDLKADRVRCDKIGEMQRKLYLAEERLVHSGGVTEFADEIKSDPLAVLHAVEIARSHVMSTRGLAAKCIAVFQEVAPWAESPLESFDKHTRKLVLAASREYLHQEAAKEGGSLTVDDLNSALQKVYRECDLETFETVLEAVDHSLKSALDAPNPDQAMQNLMDAWGKDAIKSRVEELARKQSFREDCLLKLSLETLSALDFKKYLTPRDLNTYFYASPERIRPFVVGDCAYARSFLEALTERNGITALERLTLPELERLTLPELERLQNSIPHNYNRPWVENLHNIVQKKLDSLIEENNFAEIESAPGLASLYLKIHKNKANGLKLIENLSGEFLIEHAKDFMFDLTTEQTRNLLGRLKECMGDEYQSFLQNIFRDNASFQGLRDRTSRPEYLEVTQIFLEQVEDIAYAARAVLNLYSHYKNIAKRDGVRFCNTWLKSRQVEIFDRLFSFETQEDAVCSNGFASLFAVLGDSARKEFWTRLRSPELAAQIGQSPRQIRILVQAFNFLPSFEHDNILELGHVLEPHFDESGAEAYLKVDSGKKISKIACSMLAAFSLRNPENLVRQERSDQLFRALIEKLSPESLRKLLINEKFLGQALNIHYDPLVSKLAEDPQVLMNFLTSYYSEDHKTIASYIFNEPEIISPAAYQFIYNCLTRNLKTLVTLTSEGTNANNLRIFKIFYKRSPELFFPNTDELSPYGVTLLNNADMAPYLLDLFSEPTRKARMSKLLSILAKYIDKINPDALTTFLSPTVLDAFARPKTLSVLDWLKPNDDATTRFLAGALNVLKARPVQILEVYKKVLDNNLALGPTLDSFRKQAATPEFLASLLNSDGGYSQIKTLQSMLEEPNLNFVADALLHDEGEGSIFHRAMFVDEPPNFTLLNNITSLLENNDELAQHFFTHINALIDDSEIINPDNIERIRYLRRILARGRTLAATRKIEARRILNPKLKQLETYLLKQENAYKAYLEPFTQDFLTFSGKLYPGGPDLSIDNFSELDISGNRLGVLRNYLNYLITLPGDSEAHSKAVLNLRKLLIRPTDEDAKSNLLSQAFTSGDISLVRRLAMVLGPAHMEELLKMPDGSGKNILQAAREHEGAADETLTHEALASALLAAGMSAKTIEALSKPKLEPDFEEAGKAYSVEKEHYKTTIDAMAMPEDIDDVDLSVGFDAVATAVTEGLELPDEGDLNHDAQMQLARARLVDFARLEVEIKAGKIPSDAYLPYGMKRKDLEDKIKADSAGISATALKEQVDEEMKRYVLVNCIYLKHYIKHLNELADTDKDLAQAFFIQLVGGLRTCSSGQTGAIANAYKNLIAAVGLEGAAPMGEDPHEYNFKQRMLMLSHQTRMDAIEKAATRTYPKGSRPYIKFLTAHFATEFGLQGLDLLEAEKHTRADDFMVRKANDNHAVLLEMIHAGSDPSTLIQRVYNKAAHDPEYAKEIATYFRDHVLPQEGGSPVGFFDPLGDNDIQLNPLYVENRFGNHALDDADPDTDTFLTPHAIGMMLEHLGILAPAEAVGGAGGVG